VNVDGVQPLLVEQVVKTLLQTTQLKDSPFAALLQTALSEEVSK
jgi:hypothetical protein